MMQCIPDCKKYYNLALKILDIVTSKFNKFTSQTDIGSLATRNFLVNHSCYIMPLWSLLNCKNLGRCMVQIAISEGDHTLGYFEHTMEAI